MADDGSHIALEIVKSSRHRRIIGEFGERMVMNWLSRSGFEAALVDHVGLDIIAYDPRTGKRLGMGQTRCDDVCTSQLVGALWAILSRCT